jgi:hypothetical protein
LLLQIRQLHLDVADLRRRVLVLEPERDGAATGRQHAGVHRPLRVDALPPLVECANLGLSGAYLLRAAAELGKGPILAGVTASIVYAG